MSCKSIGTDGVFCVGGSAHPRGNHVGTGGAMKDYPLLCTDETVRAIQAGLQTQVRRPVPDKWIPIVEEVLRVNGKWISNTLGYDLTSPFGVPGDRLWVRECWKHSLTKYHDTGNPDDHGGPNDPCYGYRATMTYGCGKPVPKPASNHRWRSSACMPREACRTFLPVTAVRVERIQDISEKDAIAEGCGNQNRFGSYRNYLPGLPRYINTAKESFLNLWDSIYAGKGLGVDDNPWVWVGTFRTPEQLDLR